ncbi:hypothetical protein WJX84_011137 [Apatococcus fuscideae]|uniref:Uncharacterized protein n=1 Tax=Apatococcus fuscideae TaxID=2026836 RepID=A0AAW1SKU8_9CHLO
MHSTSGAFESSTTGPSHEALEWSVIRPLVCKANIESSAAPLTGEYLGTQVLGEDVVASSAAVIFCCVAGRALSWQILRSLLKLQFVTIGAPAVSTWAPEAQLQPARKRAGASLP